MALLLSMSTATGWSYPLHVSPVRHVRPIGGGPASALDNAYSICVPAIERDNAQITDVCHGLPSSVSCGPASFQIVNQEVYTMCPLTILRTRPQAIVLGLVLAGVVPVMGAYASPSKIDACINPAAEARLKQRETALLGPKHARDHANARHHQCSLITGAANVAKPDPSVLAAYKASGSDAVGQWSDPFVIPVVGIASILLNTGKVLFWSYNPPDYLNPDASNTGVAYVWDPATRTGHSVVPPENIWCGGQTILSDGRVYVAGGNLRYPDPNAAPGQTGWEGALTDYTFDPNSETWTRQPDMSMGRWYPSVTQLADNSVVITSGYDETGTQNITQLVEWFVPSDDMNGVGTVSTVSTHDPTGLYPYQYLTQSGQMLQAGPLLTNTYLLTPGTWSWNDIPNMNSSHDLYGNGIIYTDTTVTPAAQVVVIAGGVTDVGTISNNEWLDINNPGLAGCNFRNGHKHDITRTRSFCRMVHCSP
jgi:hypothetical protein